MIYVDDKNITDDDKRVFEVGELLASGLKRFEIIDLLNSPEGEYKLGLDDDEIDYLITKAKENVLDNATDAETQLKANILAKYEFLYKKLTGKSKYRDAVDVVDRMRDLMLPKVK